MPPPGPHRPHRTQAMLPPFPPCLKPGMGPGSTNRVQGSGYPTAAQAPSSEHLPQPAGAPLIRFQPPPAHIMALAAFGQGTWPITTGGMCDVGSCAITLAAPLEDEVRATPILQLLCEGLGGTLQRGLQGPEADAADASQAHLPWFPRLHSWGDGEGNGL